MKSPIGLSFSRSLILPILFILPYIFLSSCGDINPSQPPLERGGVIDPTQPPLERGGVIDPTQPPIEIRGGVIDSSGWSDNSVESTKGMLKVLITFNDNTTYFAYAILTQATGTDIFVLDNTFSFISKPMLNVRSIAVTKWRTPAAFWSRAMRFNTVTDSLLCSSVRYSGASGSWYMEGITDTLVKSPNSFSVLNCTEKY